MKQMQDRKEMVWNKDRAEPTVRMNKTDARKKMRNLRRNLGQPERDKLQAAAMKHLLALPELQETRCFYSFVSCGTEIDTLELLRYLLAEGKMQIAVPRVMGEQMEFVRIYALKDLHPGTMGILEPAEGEVVHAKRGVMLMPGLAFDFFGNRVGYGAGYYDKFLEQYDMGQLFKVAYAFSFQLLDAIAAEEHDRLVDCIVTERGVYRCGSHSKSRIRF